MFAGLIVLYLLVSKALGFRKQTVKPAESGNKKTKKPPKGKRLSSAKKIDNDLKSNLSISNFNFDSEEGIFSSKRLTVLYATLFVVWVVIAALAVSRGSRFITTIVLPFGIMAGIFVGFACDYIRDKLDNDKWIVVIFFVLAFLAGIPLAQINKIYGAALFLAIIAIGLVTVYALKTDVASKRMPVKKYVLIIALVIALISPTVCSAYLTLLTDTTSIREVILFPLLKPETFE